MSRARDLADGNFSGDLEADSPTFVVDSANNRVGIGTASPTYNVEVADSGNTFLQVKSTSTSALTGVLFGDTSNAVGRVTYDHSDNSLQLFTNTTEKARIDSSGNLLVGTTSEVLADSSGTGLYYDVSKGTLQLKASGNIPIVCNRVGTNGQIVQFRRDGSQIGGIDGDGSHIGIGSAATGLYFYDAINAIAPAGNAGSFINGRDNAIDLGYASARFDDIYATNGTIQTSDRNEKQDIEVLSDAEQRVAVAAKGLLRKYRWRDAVAEKGDEARIHFGIIAQDLQAAFEAEGLDAGRYGMFISSTWWETERVIPAVEAQDAVYETQVDEDGNEVQVLVSEAREAQPERVVTDTFETLEEAPEGAVQRTRLGVRYPELLAFIIAAL